MTAASIAELQPQKYTVDLFVPPNQNFKTSSSTKAQVLLKKLATGPASDAVLI